MTLAMPGAATGTVDAALARWGTPLRQRLPRLAAGHGGPADLWKAGRRWEEAGLTFVTAINEELAATPTARRRTAACWWWRAPLQASACGVLALAGRSLACHADHGTGGRVQRPLPGW